ncbi:MULTISPECIES: ATP-binding protein [Pandoraea]|uniref:ATP-binding protein n=1 Tax=Pandoraea TaxID=93217 RepID=UPI001F5C7855|nr:MULTISPECIES: ATP-binding protein [Pandoraea]MCI3206254.1 two-component sensor histidine kinase [Pandoraea sp. LA3]MDN4584282.1 two-component sensor histidine kinase [Pandoraea capi]
MQTHKLQPYRYCRLRWLRFRRSWTDTRADRRPSWSRLYVRTYSKLLQLCLMVLAVPALLLWIVLPQSAWEGALSASHFVVPCVLSTLLLPAFVAYRWMRPVWLDLVMVRERAIDFSGGRFHTRAKESYSVIIGPLARTLNALAERMEKLIATQRDLTNGISHELRTPLARLRFALEILRDPTSEPHACQQALVGIDQDVTELDELIDMSLTFARLEYSSLQSNLEATSVAHWFTNQVRDATLLYAEREITPACQLDASCQVVMDKRLMSYAMRNLLRNASRYARSRIEVGMALRHGNIEIYVEDDGPGIAPADRAKIFDAFVRLDRRTGGYGLGLAITEQVMRAHHGNVAATDPVRLGGARFEIRWPAVTASTSATSLPASHPDAP